MSGGHRAAPAPVSAHRGRLAEPKASPVKVQLTRSRERAVGMRCGVPSPSRSGSLVPYAYHHPSLPRTTEGSANVSAKPLLTGLRYAARRPACAAELATDPAADELAEVATADPAADLAAAAVAVGPLMREPVSSVPVARAAASEPARRDGPPPRTTVCAIWTPLSTVA